MILCLPGLQSYGQKEVRFIKKNASEIAIDFNNADYRDFADLKRKIGDARLVLLGEETHGDGTTIEAKTRMVRFLHEQMGFNVLAFESSFYNAERAWSVAHWDKDPLNAIQNSTFELWGHTQQFLPLAKYIAGSVKTAKPLRITGFDTQLHGFFLKRDLPVDFLMFLKKYDIPFENQMQQDTFYKVYRALVFGFTQDQAVANAERISIREKLPAFKHILDQKIKDISSLPPDDVTSYWKQIWISTREYLPAILAEKKIESGELANAATIRDSLMAENLIWLTNNRYANDKIIVWAASWHIGRSPDNKSIPATEIYPPVMGDYIKNSLGKKVYSICFTAYSGEWAWYNMQTPHQIGSQTKDSFEALFNKAGFKNAFLDFKSNCLLPDGQWLSKKRAMRPYGYKDFLRSWPLIFDAVIFNSIMTRALPVKM